MANGMREKFNEAIRELISQKREDNNSYLSREEYEKKIEAVKRTKELLNSKGAKKCTTDYRLVRKYDIMTINGTERLIRPVNQDSETVFYYATTEDLFRILEEAHLAVGHGGRNRMNSELKKKYCNVTAEAIMQYLKLCQSCEKKAAVPKKGLVSNPILHSAFNSRAQVDLIDMQSQSFNDYRFIMVYQDHLTKYVLLNALKCKRAEDVAKKLLKIYTTFGAPAILHSDNGREFVNSVLNELHRNWDGVKIVHGKPRHSQSQGSVERANRDIEDMLAAWMDQHKTADWPAALKFIQFQKNRALHSGIKRSPYEAMFGCPARVGLLSVGLPADEIANIAEEDDIQRLLYNSDDDVRVDENFGTVTVCTSGTETSSSSSSRKENDAIDARIDAIKNERKRSCKALQLQAKKMRKFSNRKFPPAKIWN